MFVTKDGPPTLHIHGDADRLVPIRQSARSDREGRSTIDVLAARTDLQLVTLFAPAHGIRGIEDRAIAFETDSATGLRVHSLYGAAGQPTAEMMAGV